MTTDIRTRQRPAEKQGRAPDLVVISPLKPWICAQCDDTGDLLFMENDAPLCLECADLDHLVFLPAGDAALTRRAKKASGLVEEEALARAEADCLADQNARARRRLRQAELRSVEDERFKDSLGKEILRLFPGCPLTRAEVIAAHAGTRGSGRIGRSAAGRTLDPKAVTLAVVASVRHTDTNYDQLLMSGVPRPEARDRVRSDIDAVLDAWRTDDQRC
jgi:hypothetical protein